MKPKDKSVFICSNCDSKLNISKQIDNGIEQHMKALEKNPNTKNNVASLANEIKKTQELYITKSDNDSSSQCYLCKRFAPIKNGMIIKDWPAFLESIDNSMKQLREEGKKIGRNLLPMKKYLALKIALKAGKYIFFRGFK